MVTGIASGDYLEFKFKRCPGTIGGERVRICKERTVLDVMSGRPGAFHKKHGQHIRLLEEDTVAHRIDSYNKAVIFTDQPIPQGSMFQVKLLDKGGGWAGSIVSNDANLCRKCLFDSSFRSSSCLISSRFLCTFHVTVEIWIHQSLSR